jgi:hypothetical protein
MSIRLRRNALRVVIVALCASPASAQLRIAAWNISNYGGGRVPSIHTSVYAEFEGRSMAPDAFVLQEFLSQSAVDQFVAALNSAPGSPGDWASAVFVNGPDTDSAFAYRTGKVQLIDTVLVATGGTAPNFPRNIMRYDIRPVGYEGAEATIACYSAHMKAGSGSTDQQRRLVEAQRIRSDAEQLPEGWAFLIGGDFNIQSSNQAAYQEMVGSQFDNSGRFFDPISTPGSWNNNGSFRFVHTQDPLGAGGMDDRHDQILLSEELIAPGGLAYVGTLDGITGLPVPYSTNTWDDPNHSYRSWGNDGSTFNIALRTTGNTMVGPAIAQALKDICVGAGHLPVFLDMRVPAEVGSDLVLDFGEVMQGESVSSSFEVLNAGDDALWSASGISDLMYTLEASSGFDAPAGVFLDAAGGGGNFHQITMDTSAVGEVMGTLTIFSDSVDEPVRTVVLTGVVVGMSVCAGDTNGDLVVDFTDLNTVLASFGQSGADLPGDLNGSGTVDFADLNEVLANFGQTCP